MGFVIFIVVFLHVSVHPSWWSTSRPDGKKTDKLLVCMSTYLSPLPYWRAIVKQVIPQESAPSLIPKSRTIYTCWWIIFLYIFPFRVYFFSFTNSYHLFAWLFFGFIFNLVLQLIMGWRAYIIDFTTTFFFFLFVSHVILLLPITSSAEKECKQNSSQVSTLNLLNVGLFCFSNISVG